MLTSSEKIRTPKPRPPECPRTPWAGVVRPML